MEFRDYGPLAQAEERYLENIRKNKKSLKIVAFICLVMILIGFLGYLFLKNSNKRINRIRLENKKLEMKYDSISNVNKFISLELSKSQKKIDSLKEIEKQLSDQYEQNKQKIKNTQKKYEKNNRIDNFSSPDIIRYFTDSL